MHGDDDDDESDDEGEGDRDDDLVLLDGHLDAVVGFVDVRHLQTDSRLNGRFVSSHDVCKIYIY